MCCMNSQHRRTKDVAVERKGCFETLAQQGDMVHAVNLDLS